MPFPAPHLLRPGPAERIRAFIPCQLLPRPSEAMSVTCVQAGDGVGGQRFPQAAPRMAPLPPGKAAVLQALLG